MDREIQGHGKPQGRDIAPLLPQPACAAVVASPTRKRQGLVPDFLVPRPDRLDALMELKLCSRSTCYAGLGVAPLLHGARGRSHVTMLSRLAPSMRSPMVLLGAPPRLGLSCERSSARIECITSVHLARHQLTLTLTL